MEQPRETIIGFPLHDRIVIRALAKSRKRHNARVASQTTKTGRKWLFCCLLETNSC
jgi:hypothetical protein